MPRADSGLRRAVPLEAILFATMFFATWGSGMQKLAPFELSKLFPVLASLVILYAALFSRRRIVFPRVFNWFVAFYVAHLAFTYAFVRPELFTFESVDGLAAHGGGFVAREEGVGITAVRVLLFIAFGYAYAALMWKRSRVRWAALGYGAGLLAVLLVGGYTLEESSRAYAGEVRNAGGFLDPNSLGFSGVTAAALALFALADAGKSKAMKLALGACIVVGGVAVLQSGSRTALMACLFGGTLIMVFLDKFSTKVNVALAGVVVAATAFAFMPAALFDSLAERVSVSRVKEDHGANRLDIWENYAERLPDYAVAGVGFLRSQDVIRGSYTRTLSLTHNQYLEVLVETGAAGLALFLAALWSVWSAASRKAPGARWMFLKPMLLAALVGLMTEFMFLNLFFSRETWILLGAVAGLAHFWKDEPA